MAQVKLLKIANSLPTEHTGSADDLTVLSLSTDTINEQGGAAGVTIDGVLLKDSGATFGANVVMGDFSITGIDTLTFTDVNGTIAGIENQNLVDKSATEVIAGAWDFGGAADLEIPNSATPTVDTAGQIAVDTTITDHTGLITYYDGTEALYVIALPTANLDNTDGDVISYNAGNNEFEMVPQSGGSDPDTETYTNGNASDIVLGDVVYLEGGVDDTVELADADDIGNSDQIVGIAAATISASASGLIHVARGKVIAGVISAATAGDIYYLSVTGTSTNTLTSTAPSGGPALVRIGIAKNGTDLIFDPEFIADTTA